MLKIAVLGMRGFPGVQGGIEKHCEELYPRLARMGCDITVMTRTPYVSRGHRKLQWQGVKFVHLWCPRAQSLEAITHTAIGILRAKALSPDILHIHGIGPSLLTPVARAIRLNVVLTHHGPDYERLKWGKLAKLILRSGERAGVKYSNAVIAVSKSIAEHIQLSFSRRATYIPNGVSIPAREVGREELKRWGLLPRQYVFTACRLVPEKGLHNLVEAYQAISAPFFKLVIAGDADHETEYSRRLKKAALDTAGVVLTGHVSGKQLRELFSNAGLFVLPSYFEGLPIALLEALSYGLPVLVSDIPQHKEIPLHEFRYFRAGDSHALSKALPEAYARGISEQEQEDNWSFLREDYNWDRIAAQTLQVYTSLGPTA